MLSSLKNAPNTLQRAIDIIFSTVKGQLALFYLDNVVIILGYILEQNDHLRFVLGPLSRAGVSLKLQKCFFFEHRINYSGHVIRAGRVGMSAKVTDAIRGLPHPTNVTECKSFFSRCNEFRLFLPNFSPIARLLNRKLRMDQPFHFGRLIESEVRQWKPCRID